MNSIPAADAARAHAATERTVGDAAGETRPRSDRRVASIALAIALSAAGAVATAAHAQSLVPGWLPCEYTLTVIEPPDLIPGNEQVVFHHVNDALTAVGFLDLGLSGIHPIRWSGEEGVVILPSPPVGGGEARRINNNGWILVRAGQKSFVYIPQGDGTYGIVPLPPQHPTGAIYARDINDHNEVVGAFQFLPRGASSMRWAGFRWAPDGQGLQWYQVPGWTATELWAINNDGVIAGNVSPGNSASGGGNGARAFRDSEGQVTIIEPELPWTRSYIWFMNDAGMLTGGIWKPANAGQPALHSGAFTAPGEITPTAIEPPPGWYHFHAGESNRAGLIRGALKMSGESSGPPALMVNGQVLLLSEFIDSPYPLVASFRTIGNDGSLFVEFSSEMLWFRPIIQGADLNCDGAIDAGDLGVLLNCWHTSAPIADLNGDGIVDGVDLGLLLNAWSPR